VGRADDLAALPVPGGVKVRDIPTGGRLMILSAELSSTVGGRF